ncbi:molybdenum cofactor biosynthesis protein MoaE [Novosphingobium sp.]|uniref:molybdenum cofactor biosynthesis protein MoaE n=1 Tax=Novosphingobium sp. TaxID=1874826 RepID=UPI003342A635
MSDSAGPVDVRLLDAPFDAGAELAGFTARMAGAGGIVSFLGQVREDSGVLALEIRHYPPMTLPGFRNLAQIAARRWALDGVLLLHRVGEMGAGDPIVLVAAAARHRRDAFAATDFMMDHLKGDSWLWKRERTAAGWRWIEPRDEDHSDRARWAKYL